MPNDNDYNTNGSKKKDSPKIKKGDARKVLDAADGKDKKKKS
jgi:hypothetical protein